MSKRKQKSKKEIVIDQGVSEVLSDEALDSVAGGIKVEYQSVKLDGYLLDDLTLSVDNKANKAGPLLRKF